MENNKQKVAIFGNCITKPIYKMLQTSAEFNKKYDIELLKYCFQCKKDSVPAIYNAIKNCDVLITQPIVGQHYIDLGLDTKTLKELLPPDAKLVTIPVPFFTGYNPEQFYLHLENGELVGRCIGLSHPYHNKIIMWGYVNNLTCQETLDILNKNNKSPLFAENVQKDIEELRRREESTDFKISDFIEQNYKINRLFWTQNHPTNILLEFMAQEILKMLHIEDDINCEENFLDKIQTPILNSVKEELELNFDDNNVTTTEEIKKYYKYYAKNKTLVKLNKKFSTDFCKDIKIEQTVKRYLLFGFIPVYKSVKSDNVVKNYVFGIPIFKYKEKCEK